MQVWVLVLASLASFARMLVAYILSLLIAIFLGVAMARNRVVEATFLPILDILQSIPILGFYPIILSLVVGSLHKGIGLEIAAVLLIVTSLVWNMIFGVYAAVKSLDPSVIELAKVYRLGLFSRLAYIYVPSSLEALASNSLISWAGGWFFLTSAEIISMGSEEHKLFGLGSLIMDLYNAGDIMGFYIAVATLFIIIIVSYLLLFNPAVNIVAQSRIVPAVDSFFNYLARFISLVWSAIIGAGIRIELRVKHQRIGKRVGIALFIIPIAFLAQLNMSGLAHIVLDMYAILPQFFTNFLVTLARVAIIVLISFISSVFLAYLAVVKRWGKAIAFTGEALASIPAILWWPLLSPLYSMPWLISFTVFLQGALWYEFFNVMLFGVPKIPSGFLEVAEVYRVRGFKFFRYILLPSLLPSIASGALSAWGGAWNASIVAEYFSFGSNDLRGIGSMLSKYTYAGDLEHAMLVVILWALMIAFLNKAFWSRVFKRVERAFAEV